MESNCSFWDSCWEEGCEECGGLPVDTGGDSDDPQLWDWAIK